MFSLLPWLLDNADKAQGSSLAKEIFQDAQQPIVELVNAAVSPLLMIVSALAAIYCILLGAKLAKSEEPQEREKAKQALRNAIIGFVLIFVLLVVLAVVTGPLTKWYENYQNASTEKKAIMMLLETYFI